MKTKVFKSGNLSFLITDQGAILRLSGWLFRERLGRPFRMWMKSKKVSPSHGFGGAPHVNLGGRNHYVNRLVAKLFIPNPRGLKAVRHINGDKMDNRAGNLEWVSHKTVINLAIKKRGGRWAVRLSSEKRAAIAGARATGATYRDLERRFKVSMGTVANCSPNIFPGGSK